MKKSRGRKKSADAELQALRARLQEAEQTLEAIRQGQIEALLVNTSAGPRVYTLEGADHRYRRLVETMNEGALLVNPSGLIIYSNAAFARMLATPLESIIGRSLSEFVETGSRPSCDALLAAGSSRPAAEELTLRGHTSAAIAAFVSMSPSEQSEPGISVIVTNLTPQKRNDEIVASERLASSILDQAAEAIVVCNPEGVVIRANRTARDLAAGRALRRHVLEAFPLRIPGGPRHPALQALAGEVAVSVESALAVPGSPAMYVLCTAAPLLNEQQQVLGCVMSMTDITKQKQAETERLGLLEAERAARAAAERARADAEASNRSKDEFLATVSHELRTPLNAIVGWSRLLASGSLPDDRRVHAVQVIRRNADAQARLVEDLLDVSRITSGQLRLDVQTVEPARVIAAVIESVRPALDAKEITLQAEISTEDTSVLGDAARLQQVVWNLVSNAAKFTPKHGKIAIYLRSLPSCVEIEVTDDGAGMKPEFLPYVFDRFRQADGGIDRLHGGLGLGLAISRHLVELHGGTIAVASEGLQRGSTFTVRLPHAARRDSALTELSSPKERDSNEPLGPLQDLSDLHVLVVEDDEDSRELFVAILRKCGARVTSTDSGQGALDVLAKETPSVLVSDLGMAKMDGYTLIRHVRQLPEPTARKVPALALTAFARSEDRRRALSEGFQMHLAKPVDPSEFAAAVGTLGRPPVAKSPPTPH